MIVKPKCENFKDELVALCDEHKVNYNITTDDTHIVVHIKLERDFTNREHIK